MVRRRPDRGQEDHPALHPFHLAGYGHGNRPIDPVAHAGEGNIGARGPCGAAPFAHRSGEHRGHRMRRIAAFLVEQFVQTAAGPEFVLEHGGGFVRLAQHRPFFEHDGPNPYACAKQANHYKFNNYIGLPKQAPQRQIARRRAQIHRIHCPIHCS